MRRICCAASTNDVRECVYVCLCVCVSQQQELTNEVSKENSKDRFCVVFFFLVINGQAKLKAENVHTLQCSHTHIDIYVGECVLLCRLNVHPLIADKKTKCKVWTCVIQQILGITFSHWPTPYSVCSVSVCEWIRCKRLVVPISLAPTGRLPLEQKLRINLSGSFSNNQIDAFTCWMRTGSLQYANVWTVLNANAIQRWEFERIMPNNNPTNVSKLLFFYFFLFRENFQIFLCENTIKLPDFAET